MNKEQLFEEIDEIYSEWHGGELHIGIERTERIKEALNRAINFIPCCTELKSNEALSFDEWLSHFKKENDCYWLNKEILYCKEAMKLHYDNLPDE